MLKFIGNIIRYIIFIYVVFVIIVFSLYHANKKYYGGNYTNIAGYTFVIPDNDYLAPDVNKGDFVVIRLSNPDIYYEEGDLAFIEFNDNARLEKIIKVNDDDSYIVNFINPPDPLPVKEPETNETKTKKNKKASEEEVEQKYVFYEQDFKDKTYKLQDIEGKAILYGPKVNEWYSILTSWWTLGLMVLYLFLFPTIFYKRYH